MGQAAAPEPGEQSLLQRLVEPLAWPEAQGYFLRVGERSGAVLGLWELQLKSSFWPKGCLWAL